MAKRRHKSDAAPHLRIRIDEELRQRLEAARQASERTLTGEIVFRLKRSFDKEDQAELVQSAAQKGAEMGIKSIMASWDSPPHGLTPEAIKRISAIGAGLIKQSK
jgi:TraY domain